jgi:hypothetical protein
MYPDSKLNPETAENMMMSEVPVEAMPEVAMVSYRDVVAGARSGCKSTSSL